MYIYMYIFIISRPMDERIWTEIETDMHLLSSPLLLYILTKFSYCGVDRTISGRNETRSGVYKD